MRKRKLASVKTLLSAVICAALCLVSCENTFLHKGESKKQGKLGSIKVSFIEGNGENRSAVPVLAGVADTYRITLTCNSNHDYNREVVITEPSYILPALEAGDWEIKGDALKNGTMFASGKVSGVSVTAGNTAIATVTLSPLTTGGGTGNISLALAFSSDTNIDFIECTLYQANGTTEALVQPTTPIVINGTTEKSATITASGVTPGSYSLALTFRQGGAGGSRLGTLRDAVTVCPGLATDRWISPTGALLTVKTILSAEISSTNANLANLTIDGLDPEYQLPFASLGSGPYQINDIPREAVVFTAISSHPQQTIGYSWNNAALMVSLTGTIQSGTASPPLPLDSGVYTLTVNVTAPDGVSLKEYTIEIDQTPFYTPNSPVAMKMVKVPAGRFQRDGENGGANTSYVGSFYIGKYEVTQEQYQTVTGLAPSNTSGGLHPVEMVTVFDAIEFCNALSVLEGYSPVYTIANRNPGGTAHPITGATVTKDLTKNGYRLPTEMEWMWAAMGATKGPMDAGINRQGYLSEFAGDPDPNIDGNDGTAYAWMNPALTGSIEVGMRKPNALGIYDMSGNVFEFCSETVTAPSNWPVGDIINYINPQGSFPLIRGGGYTNQPISVIFKGRGYPFANHQDPTVGFRVARGQVEYALGDRGPAGGWVFYDKGSYSNEWRYLEAGPWDATPSTKWSTMDNPNVPLATGVTGMGMGKENTDAIIAMYSGNAYAATLCDSLTTGGYDDWYLPSTDELNGIYTVLKLGGYGGFETGKYWTSTIRSGTSYVDEQDFSTGVQNCTMYTFGFSFAVRAVRRF